MKPSPLTIARGVTRAGSTLLAALVLSAAAFTAPAPAPEDPLARDFARPPDAAKPWAYWWWLDGSAAPEGITRDLEEMRRQGISGVLLFDAGEGKGSPTGPIFMSGPWRDLFRHAIREAARLGIEVGVNLCSGWDAGGTWVGPEDAAKRLVLSTLEVEGPAEVDAPLPAPPSTGGWYGDVAVVAHRIRIGPPRDGEAAAAPQGILHWPIKSANALIWAKTRGALQEELPERPGEEDCRSAEVMDLTALVDGSGRLRWKAPPGRWAVIRFGATLLGSKTKCVSPGSQGYEIDILSAEAMDRHFAATGALLAADAGELLGKSLRYFHIDSYEVGADCDGAQPTWTPRFREEFRRRRGYDLLPFLPALAGRIVDGRTATNRFLRDIRRTIGDLIAGSHYGRLGELSRRLGLGIHPESGGPFWAHIDALQCLGRSEIPMGEFWKRRLEQEDWIWYREEYPLCDTVKQAATAAHIYGKALCQAEAFTSMGPNWEEAPWMLKDIGDLAFCAGLTRNVLCFYVHQPRLDVLPGDQWEAAGTHFDRNITWWPMIHGWLDYLARCQVLLRQGHFAADLCYFLGEDVPAFVPSRAHMDPPLPKGFDCDAVNAEVLLDRLESREGRLVLPDGLSYRLLVLPDRRTMSPEVLRKIRRLVDDGATVIGPPPERTPGLAGHPASDGEVRALAASLWGEVDGKGVKERRVGRGRIIWGKSPGEVLSGDGIAPAFEARGAGDLRLDFIQRSGPEGEIYFISNQRDRSETTECLFRVTGRQPEIWDPVTGALRDAPEFRDTGTRTALEIRLAPRGSLFVLFRRSATSARGSGRNFPPLRPAAALDGPWTVRFDPARGGPGEAVFNSLEDWTGRSEEGIRFYSGIATYRKAFDMPQPLRGGGRRIHLDLGAVRHMAAVRLNGRDLGVVWTAPWSVEITAALRPEGNLLEIDVANLWPNRLIGDARLPPEKRITRTNVKKFTKDSPLLESGLLGPVTLQVEDD